MTKRVRTIVTKAPRGSMVLAWLLTACSGSNDNASQDDSPSRPRDDASLGANQDTSIATEEASVAPCESRACWCSPYCDKVAATGCRNDPARTECITRCVEPTVEECADESYALLVCRALLAQDAYGCAPALDEIMASGCQLEVDAFYDCLDANPPDQGS